ncbi:CRISPR-associated ring nuclease Csm6 [Alysiella filiformis]|uniref:CRISPR-associated protein, NE0113 family n=1 Tax=Alysiella filiformis DSM 16848 TaxID=1120981 RepID=A0A286ESV8_9NEIS|nr:CRISPR-associated ring nuclease Csm6 [Alysiella filiformis]UBQ56949.1 TIGR02584 family CRISPR-associated protein [Alysiella filiformis DSM 16848]SOD74012.1 CRISPR-associated protein, NE0113 family [Alysiella filiformis DSM 16848]
MIIGCFYVKIILNVKSANNEKYLIFSNRNNYADYYRNCWALACDPNKKEKWIPDEIHILTTAHGFNLINTRLLKKGVFERFKQDYPILKNIQFDQSYITVIHHNGDKLTDLKTPDDNELAADLICQAVREFTSDDNVCLHVSIAGGRKTMGFYAGYALSLYGRSQDKMSHVLVESEFESAVGFYYPTPKDMFVEQKYTNKRLNAKNAKVWLAEIPFVRMREAIYDKHQLKSSDSFSQVVEKINQSFGEVKLTLNIAEQIIVVNDKFIIDDLEPKEFAFLYWFADLKKQDKEGIIAPTKKWSNANKDEKDAIDNLTDEFKVYYDEFKNVSDDFRMDKAIFENLKSKLKAKLEQHLGVELSQKVAIIQDGRGKPFYLNVLLKNIEILDSFNK